MKILVIDDDAQMRFIVREIMQHHGWEVLEASEGQNGLMQARAHLPDLILCDFEMDGMNGHQILAALRADATATIPFILMTGAPERAGLRKTMELGADDYLAKPFDQLQLLKSVDARVTRARLERERAEQKLSALRANIIGALPHSLLTPLNGIVGYAELAKSDYDSFSREELRDMISTMHESAVSLARLVDRFLTFTEYLMLAANSPSSGVNPAPRPNDPTVELERTARKTAARHQREADLVFQLASVTPAISSAHLSRLVEELIDNACKFSPPRSAITVNTINREGHYQLEISDSGRGLTPAQIDSIGAFMQFDRRRYEQQGTGLGLGFVRVIADVNAGALDLRSEPGRGTTVSIKLPLATA